MIYSSNSFSFAFCELKNKDFGVVCFFFNSSMFSICAFLRNSLPGLCSFSLNCARRLSETQTLPSYPLQEPHRQVEPPLLPAEEATIIYKSSCLSAFSEWSIVTPENRQKQLPLTEANEDGSGGLLNRFWNV